MRVILFAIIIGLLIPMVGCSSDQEVDLAPIQEQLDSLSQRLYKLEAKSPTNPYAQTSPNYQSQIDSLESSIESLSRRISCVASGYKIQEGVMGGYYLQYPFCPY